MSLAEFLIVLLGLVVVVLLVTSAHRRTSPHKRSTPGSRARIEAEERLNSLKGGSLWGDVYQPRFMASRHRRRPG